MQAPIPSGRIELAIVFFCAEHSIASLGQPTNQIRSAAIHEGQQETMCGSTGAINRDNPNGTLLRASSYCREALENPG